MDEIKLADGSSISFPSGQIPEETRIIVPVKFMKDPPATTPFEALVRARDQIAQEGRWASGSWFKDGAPEDAVVLAENGSVCGDWNACVMGILGIVTDELRPTITKTWEMDWDAIDNGQVGAHHWKSRWEEPTWGEVENAETTVAPITRKCFQILNRVSEKGVDNGYGSKVHETSIIRLNDNEGRDSVLNALNKAIEIAELIEEFGLDV